MNKKYSVALVCGMIVFGGVGLANAPLTDLSDASGRVIYDNVN